MAYVEQLVCDLGPAIEAGARQFAHATAEALAKQACPLLAHIGPHSPAFLEPLLFAQLSRADPDITLEQLLVGYVDRDHPALEVAVGSDLKGRIHLPRIGSLATGMPQARLTLRFDPASQHLALHRDHDRIPFEFSPAMFAGPGTMEVSRHRHPLLERLFIDREGQPVAIDVERAVQVHAHHLEKAWQLLDRHCPIYAKRIAQLVRHIVVFNAQGVNSFANIEAHGAAFINADEDADEILFVEELAHQCGHVLFSTATVCHEELFAVSPHAPLKAWTGKDGETRSLYVVLHALFTEIAIMSCLEPLLETGAAGSVRQTSELEGRLAFIISRFAADLHNLGHPEVFSPRGASLYRRFLEIFNQVHGKWRDLVRAADFSNQTYNFSRRSYLARNGVGRELQRSTDALELEQLRPIGFGAYRITRAAAHAQALAHALSQGCNLIDTAASYGDGQSEALIGQVLRAHPEYTAFVITKAGYVGGDAEACIGELGLPQDALIALADGGKHCIHPDFLHSQMQASSARLGRKCLDGFLLHNPEYHLHHAAAQATEPDYYDRIGKAFEFLEGCVRQGRIRYYGISSNTLVNDSGEAGTTRLDELLRIARSTASAHHFRLVEFPFNLLERGAAVAHHCGESLISMARRNGLTTFSNRPFNALRNGKAIRLASREAFSPGSSDGDAAWRDCLAWVACRMQALGISGRPEEFDVLSVLGTRWREFDTTEAVAYVFEAHLIPLLVRLYGGPLPPGEMEAFNRFHDSVLARAIARTAAQAESVRRECIADGILRDDGRPLALAACESYLQAGIDHVLVGMRRPEYVDQLKPLLETRGGH